MMIKDIKNNSTPKSWDNLLPLSSPSQLGVTLGDDKMKLTELKTGMNITTKSGDDDWMMYTKYIINKVMPKLVEYTEIWNINHGTDTSGTGRMDKSTLINLLNMDTITDIYTPNGDYDQYLKDGGQLNYRAYQQCLKDAEGMIK